MCKYYSTLDFSCIKCSACAHVWSTHCYVSCQPYTGTCSFSFDKSFMWWMGSFKCLAKWLFSIIGCNIYTYIYIYTHTLLCDHLSNVTTPLVRACENMSQSLLQSIAPSH